ncbi:hypothetical protein [Microbacterium sp. UCD-TDU]|uniref:hypothetical protein n=1 Tax=Microbacterium sp. UCD-TDU TaxID=1247714 RepID=UPI001F3CA8AA|nr:hypothetical protein [Microbacterium sp. UCD-TDU]
MEVRGGKRLPVTSPIILVDPEPGFGVANAYTIIGRNSTGDVVGSWPIGSVVVNCDRVVIQQPLDPQLAVEVKRLAGMAATLTRETPGSLVYPQGEGLPGFVGLGPRQGLKDVPLLIRVESTADADMLQRTLGTYGDDRQLPIWLVRTPPGQRLPRIFFCRVRELEELDSSWWSDRVQFRTSVTEVRPPAVSVSGIALTHSDMKVFFATHTQVKARYATHSDIKRDTSLIGAADA